MSFAQLSAAASAAADAAYMEDDRRAKKLQKQLRLHIGKLQSLQRMHGTYDPCFLSPHASFDEQQLQQEQDQLQQHALLQRELEASAAAAARLRQVLRQLQVHANAAPSLVEKQQRQQHYQQHAAHSEVLLRELRDAACGQESYLQQQQLEQQQQAEQQQQQQLQHEEGLSTQREQGRVHNAEQHDAELTAPATAAVCPATSSLGSSSRVSTCAASAAGADYPAAETLGASGAAGGAAAEGRWAHSMGKNPPGDRAGVDPSSNALPSAAPGGRAAFEMHAVHAMHTPQPHTSLGPKIGGFLAPLQLQHQLMQATASVPIFIPDSKIAASLVQEKRDNLAKIQRDVKSIQSLYEQMAFFTIEQGSRLEVVGQTLEGSRQEAARAAREIATAVRAERRRKCRRCIFNCSLFLVLLSLGFTIWWSATS